MSSYYLKSGNTFRVSSKEAMDLHESLPPSNYVVKFSPDSGFFLERIENFSMPKKLYGRVNNYTQRILDTFGDRSGATGVLLCGEKGSGKSLLAKNLAITAAHRSIPTLVINTPFRGDNFNSFIQDIEQPAIVLFDEFEKVYDNEAQQEILTLLDGVYPSKKLFVLTTNDKWGIDRHMHNRPGRIYYLIDYDGVDPDFITEYCQDNLNNKKEIKRLVQISGTFDKFNFDMLKAIVEEMNRFNESVSDALRILNVKPEAKSNQTFTVEMYIGNNIVPDKALLSKMFRGNPLLSRFSIDYLINNPKFNRDDINNYEEEFNEISEEFSTSDLKSVMDDGKKYVFVNGNNVKVVLTKQIEKNYNYLDYL